MREPSRNSTATRTIRLALTAAALLGLAGCPTQKQLAQMPGLADVTPTGPAGRKCYEYCAQAEASCKHMCPGDGGLCYDDCVRDTKLCLQDCPELRSHLPPPED